jgi:hypothetical protein
MAIHVDTYAPDRSAPAALRLLTAWGQSAWPLVLAGGLVVGLAWGINARLWMRFISTSAEFTWSGTLFIVIAFGIVGLAQAAAYLGRRASLTRRLLTGLRTLGVISLLPLGFGAGASMIPTVILATVAWTHRAWPRWLRGTLAVAALAPAVATALSFFGDLPPIRAAVGTIWFVVIYSLIIWAARYSLGPQLDGWRVPLAARVVGLAALAALVLLATMLTTQVAG